MAPVAQAHTSPHGAMEEHTLDENAVVISGMSAQMPGSRDIKEFTNTLYNKVNLVNADNLRWSYIHPEVNHYTGKIPDLNRFDAQFFKVHYYLGNNMDTMARKVLEQSYQAIYDAGLNPQHLSGKKVGVYIGSCFSETEKISFYVANQKSGFGIAGCNKSMFANRVSYWLNVNGPSLSIDAACCSSMVALEQAYLAMSHGECEAAIVGGAHLCLHPQSLVHYGRIIKLCTDGKTKSFDQNADGCAKSEAINVLFLQKAKDALRIYAKVVHVKTKFTTLLNEETGPKYGFYREPIVMANFFKEFYEEARISPQAVEYVEAFGSAASEVDKVELDTIDEVVCKGRTRSLPVGSVMSNIGYGEAASGISAIIKVLLGYHKGELAANLHCNTLRQDVAALREGRIHIVTENERFDQSYSAINNMSITGLNALTLLCGYKKSKDLSRYKSNIPHLVTVSGRHESAVNKILNEVKSKPIDPEELALLHNIHEMRIFGHLARGFIILDTSETQETEGLCEEANYFDEAKRPLWFVYSGMGSQWVGMGTQLMRIPIFAAAIERCRKVLEPKGVDIIHIITSPDKTIFDNILHSFVGIAAIQIGLTDILRELGLVPDKIIGHSVGELGCAYADGCFTTEEMILSAYCRGLVSVQTPFIRGSMAAVGIGYQQISKLCPSEIEVACHNGRDSSTISGPVDNMHEFIAHLTSQGIFAKEVPCSNIAYHSKYIAGAGPSLLKYLSEVIKKPKLRSERWVSTSVPEEKWNESAAKYSSAEYHTNNLLNPVLFEETSRLVPRNAVLVEIAPHGLLQAILKRSLPDGCRHIPLTKRGHADNVLHLLEAIGKLYMEGYNLKINVLYPKMEFPVSTGTPHLSHLVEWDHSEKWAVPLYLNTCRTTAAACKFIICIHDKEYSYLQGHVLRGQTLFPFAGALVLVWDTLAMFLGVTKKQISVQFHDVHLHSQPTLHSQRQLRLNVAIHRGTGRFEILDDHYKIATGFVSSSLLDISKKLSQPFQSNGNLDLHSDDIYQILYDRDYEYSDEFRSIHSVNLTVSEACVLWQNNWITLIDGMLQMNALKQVYDGVSQPAYIKRLTIDVTKHCESAIKLNDNLTVMVAQIFKLQDYTRCGGVLIENVIFRNIPPRIQTPIVMQTFEFVPHFGFKDSDVFTTLQIYLQIVSENLNKNVTNIIEIFNNELDSPILDMTKHVLNDISATKFVFEQIKRERVLRERDLLFFKKADLVVVRNLSTDGNIYQKLYDVLRPGAFVINKESDTETVCAYSSVMYRVVCSHKTGQTRLELLRWRPITNNAVTSTFYVRCPSDIALLSTMRTNLLQPYKLYVFAPYPSIPGLKKLIEQWQRKSDHNEIYLIMINHKISDKDNLNKLPDTDLAFNVLNHDTWGGEYYVPLQDSALVVRELRLKSSRIGNLKSLQWVEAQPLSGPGITVNIHYAGINDCDVKRATGVIPFKLRNGCSETYYGMDFSGVTERGDRVMGLIEGGAVCGRVSARPELLWPVPAHWSLEEAATVPLPYAHAFYCLAIKTELTKESSVLIHGGAGALGQAAIAIALAIGCNVFTTVNDIRKKYFLLKLFPTLKEEHIGNSRDNSFGDMVLSSTKGRGCDIVISCVREELRNISLSCCGSSGFTLDTVKNTEDFTFGMHYFTKTRSYVRLDLSSIFENHDIETMKKLQMLVSEGIALGYVRPLTRVIYRPCEVSRAFRLMLASQHRGRVLLQMEDIVPSRHPRLICSPDLCHLILCNEDGFGVYLAERLVRSGAKKLCIHFTDIPKHFKLKIQSWEKLDVYVKISSKDLSNSTAIVGLINECIQIGPVEGIFVSTYGINVSDNKTVQRLTTIMNTLDLTSRTLCPFIKYFAVVGTDNSIGQQICVSRTRDGFAATSLQLPLLRKFNDIKCSDQKTIGWRSAVDATERALRSAQPVVLAQLQEYSQKSLMEEICTIADITIAEDIHKDNKLTLKDLGMTFGMSAMISSYLLDNYNVMILEKDIPLLTVEKIQNIEESLSETGYKDIKGLEMFFSYIDSDELLATTEMVSLPTLTHNTAMSDDNLDVTQTCLYIVPGLEGHYGRFQLLCERLKIPAFVLQPGLDKLTETIQDTAQRFANILLKKLKLKKYFYLLGYENGVTITLEIAAILENHGLTGTVFCVGGTPDEFRETLEEQLSGIDTEETLQDTVARHMYALMVGGSSDHLQKALEKASSWNDKVEICVRSLCGRVPHSAQYARALIEAAYSRIRQVRHYASQPRALRSQLVLLHSPNPYSTSLATSLQCHSQQPVVVHELSAPLAHATKDLHCAAIINQYLHSTLLDAFENKNLCETYISNEDMFKVASDPI